MSSLLLIATADKRPSDPDENTRVHQGILDRLNAEAGRAGWKGSKIHTYVVIGGHVSITVAPGDAPAAIADLRAFRAAQLRVIERQPEQGRLL